MMQCNWLGERVATVDVDRAISNVINNKEDAGWGPNAVFRFPTSGGTGAIWKGVAKMLPADKQACGVIPCIFLFLTHHTINLHTTQPNACSRLCLRSSEATAQPGLCLSYPPPPQRYNQQVVNIDKDSKTVTLASGSKIQYQSLMSTLPLDITLRWLGKPEWADGLQHSSSHIVGVGIRGLSPHGSKCWLYYPEDDCPYYR